MKFNFNFFLKNCYINIIKFGKIKSNFIRLKKILRKLNSLLNIFFNYKVFLYLIKISYKKGDKCLVGELGFYRKNKNYLLFKS